MMLLAAAARWVVISVPRYTYFSTSGALAEIIYRDRHAMWARASRHAQDRERSTAHKMRPGSAADLVLSLSVRLDQAVHQTS